MAGDFVLLVRKIVVEQGHALDSEYEGMMMN